MIGHSLMVKHSLMASPALTISANEPTYGAKAALH